MAFDNFLKNPAIARKMLTGEMFSDDDARRMLEAMRGGQKVNDTQNAIVKYAKPMAEFLAEAARATAAAGQSMPMAGRQIGTDPMYALDRWLAVIRDEAQKLILEQQRKERECDRPKDGKRKPLMNSSKGSEDISSNRLLEGSANREPPIASGASKAGSSESK